MIMFECQNCPVIGTHKCTSMIFLLCLSFLSMYANFYKAKKLFISNRAKLFISNIVKLWFYQTVLMIVLKIWKNNEYQIWFYYTSRISRLIKHVKLISLTVITNITWTNNLIEFLPLICFTMWYKQKWLNLQQSKNQSFILWEIHIHITKYNMTLSLKMNSYCGRNMSEQCLLLFKDLKAIISRNLSTVLISWHTVNTRNRNGMWIYYTFQMLQYCCFFL